MLSLNEEQQRAVLSTSKHTILIAGAGSGKTRVIVARIHRLLNEGCCPKDILAITFTRKAAQEMKQRLKQVDVYVQTFHQFCYGTLSQAKVEKIDVSTTNPAFSSTELLAFSVYKNSCFSTKKPKKYDTYQKELKQANQLDYEDLMLEMIKHLKDNPKMYTFKHIFVDEFQDTNVLQYELLKLLCNNETCTYVVGDPDQSIYGFRGAHMNIISQYQKAFHAKMMTLTYNYRSQKEIVRVANRLIGFNHNRIKKQLVAVSNQVQKVYFKHCMTRQQECMFVIDYIKKQLSVFNGSDIAILFRHHHRAFDLMLNLIEAEISFQKDEDEVKRHAVQLLSMHQAKGLEFEVVLILGVEGQTIPDLKNHQYHALEEERRLLFVAMTRAKQHLILTAVQKSLFRPQMIRQMKLKK